MAAAAAVAIKKRKENEAAQNEGKSKPKPKKADSDGEDSAPVKIEPPATGWRKFQPLARKVYHHIYVQVSVAFLIGMNFMVNIIQAQIDPTGTKHADEFGVFEWFFNIVFLIELALNMYSSWCCPFWHSGWNIFDFNVVLIGWMFQLQVPLPGPMKLLRMMRAFRVFRLFKRIESLRKIMDSLARAVPGVMNAFLIQLIVMCIYAIIGVDRFQDYGEGGFFTNEVGAKIPLTTGRQQDYGFEYFGDFGKALYTMFQVLTGESWSEAICRPLFHSNNPMTSTGSAFFFVSFVILNAVVLINVVVAVLLEKMVDEPAPAGGDDDDEPQGDPVKDNVEATMGEVAALRKQLDHVVEVSAAMQQKLADVDSIKEQLTALLAHNGIKVVLPPATTELVASPTNGDDQNGNRDISSASASNHGRGVGGWIEGSSPEPEILDLTTNGTSDERQKTTNGTVVAGTVMSAPTPLGEVTTAPPPALPGADDC